MPPDADFYSFPQRSLMGAPTTETFEISLQMFPNSDTIRLYYGEQATLLPPFSSTGDSMGKTFTNTTGGSSITVGDNGYNPYLTIKSGYPTKGGIGDMVLPGKDVPGFVQEVLKSTTSMPKTSRIKDVDGRESFKAGNGDTKALVYAPESDTMAERNLNFAVANLAAYVDWKNGDGLKRLEEAKAEAERKAKAEEEAGKLEKEALRAYNAYNGLNHTEFPDTYHGRAAKARWISVVRELKGPQLSADRIVAGSISLDKINPSRSLSDLLTERALNARTIPGSGYTLRGF